MFTQKKIIRYEENLMLHKYIFFIEGMKDFKVKSIYNWNYM